jgi:hypothetical protein
MRLREQAIHTAEAAQHLGLLGRHPGTLAARGSDAM